MPLRDIMETHTMIKTKKMQQKGLLNQIKQMKNYSQDMYKEGVEQTTIGIYSKPSRKNQLQKQCLNKEQRMMVGYWFKFVMNVRHIFLEQSSKNHENLYFLILGAIANEPASTGDDVHKVNKRRKFSYVYTSNKKRCIMCKFRNQSKLFCRLVN